MGNKRRLAYEINDLREGFLHDLNVKSNAEAINEFDRLAKINEDILRHKSLLKKKKKIIDI